MWYTATSVIKAIEQCGQLSVASKTQIPSCPKKGNNVHCLKVFPECEGKNQGCSQRLSLINGRGDPKLLYFEYYIYKDGQRDGRIKQKNITLLWLISKYQIDVSLMSPI
jgi:hypothetical protein